MSVDIKRSAQVDGQCRVVQFRDKAINEICEWLENTILTDDDFEQNVSKQNIYQLFVDIKTTLSNPHDANEEFADFIKNNLCFKRK